jgi:hypothetical protein
VPKFLKAVRLDDSDAEIFSIACDADEWVTAGGFAVCDLAHGLHREPKCRCADSFLSLTRRARCTLAEVVEVSDTDLALFRDQMVQHLIFDWRAPDADAAGAIADEEIAYTSELATGFPAEVWITVKRSAGADGQINERYDQYQRLMIGAHKI